MRKKFATVMFAILAAFALATGSVGPAEAAGTRGWFSESSAQFAP